MRRLPAWCAALALAALAAAVPLAVQADSDDAPVPAGSSAPGSQALAGTPPLPLEAPGESRLVRREDGTYAAVPETRGRTKIFRLVAREATWTLKPGLTVLAKTYDGVVPGPTLVVDQGDRVVIDYVNDLAVPDTIHLHGIQGIAPSMDGVPGISQALVAPHGGRFRYAFTANRDGTYFYHSHDRLAVLDAGLYGGIIVRPSHPRAVERGLAHDDLEVLSSWRIGGPEENHFTINGKEYPATQPIEVRRGERTRIRWIDLSSENDHTMHTHGHDQRVIARDARPVAYDDEEDTVLLGPGQRVDVVVRADAVPGTWLVHCHVLDHVEDADGMPAGLVTAIHYAGTPELLGAMALAMGARRPDGSPMAMPANSSPKPMPLRLLLAGALVAAGLVVLAVVGALKIALPRRRARAAYRKPTPNGR